ncbi:MAG: DUF4097 family beta strand repeat-containing protein [Acidimicrobiales bacterium]
MPRFDTPEPITVTLDIGVGDIRIVASDRADTVVTVQPSDAASIDDVKSTERITVAYANGALVVKAPKSWRRYKFGGGTDSIDVLIELPTNSRLLGEAAMASLLCTGTLGECRYKTGADDISIERVDGPVELKTGSGSISVDWIGEGANVRNGNGGIRIGEVIGELEAKSANGAIRVDRAGASATTKTALGDIRFDEVSAGSIDAETAMGKVDVAVRRGSAALLDLYTSYGRVNNVLEAGERPNPSEQAVEIRVHTSYGDITISRAEIGLGAR